MRKKLMKVICHGIDLVDCRRMEELIGRHDQHVMKRVFTEAEQQYCKRHRDQYERWAGRFAVKEAVMKMLGVGWGAGVSWRDIETTNKVSGKPMVKLSGMIGQTAKEMGIEEISVSVTHAAGLAIASVVALGDSTGGSKSDE
jgi:holo-[acyl-carrier protein] synthase